jgi:hypothetical protein
VGRSGKLLLAFANIVILCSESHGTHDHILLSRDSGSRDTTAAVESELNLMLRPTVSRPVYLGIKHPSGTSDQSFIAVRQLEAC